MFCAQTVLNLQRGLEKQDPGARDLKGKIVKQVTCMLQKKKDKNQVQIQNLISKVDKIVKQESVSVGLYSALFWECQ